MAQVVAGDLEAVEQQPSALGVDGVGGDASDDLGEGELDGSVVVQAVEAREVEAGFAALTAPVGEHGHPVGVVVVAEVLVAECQRAAAAAVDEDVTAEEGLARGFQF